jgi:hypothetical protein
MIKGCINLIEFSNICMSNFPIFVLASDLTGETEDVTRSYLCQDSTKCLQVSLLVDGMPHCPMGDDEKVLCPQHRPIRF